MFEDNHNADVRLEDDLDYIAAICQEAIWHRLRLHKRLGFPVAVWQDGQVVTIPPEEIDVPEEAVAK